ncbi:MAG TPA: hypothetical protein VF855_14090 [Acidimicrobiales bacterium]
MTELSDAVALSSIATSLSDLHDRVVVIAGHYEGTNRDDLLGTLYEAERQMRASLRAVERGARLLR